MQKPCHTKAPVLKMWNNSKHTTLQKAWPIKDGEIPFSRKEVNIDSAQILWSLVLLYNLVYGQTCINDTK